MYLVLKNWSLLCLKYNIIKSRRTNKSILYIFFKIIFNFLEQKCSIRVQCTLRKFIIMHVWMFSWLWHQEKRSHKQVIIEIVPYTIIIKIFHTHFTVHAQNILQVINAAPTYFSSTEIARERPSRKRAKHTYDT